MNKPAKPVKRPRSKAPQVPWVKTPQQTRSMETKERFLDASMKVLSEKGLHGYTIGEVCKVAERPTSSLYHLFTDKQTIIQATLEKMRDELSLTVETGLQGQEWESVALIDILDGYIRWNLEMNRKYSGVLEAQRVFAVQNMDVKRGLQAQRKHNNALLLDLLRPHYSEVGHEDPEAAIMMVLETMRAAISRRTALHTLGSQRHPSRKSDDNFAKELLRMMAAYLNLES